MADLDENSMFYLAARGIDRRVRNMLRIFEMHRTHFNIATCLGRLFFLLHLLSIYGNYYLSLLYERILCYFFHVGGKETSSDWVHARAIR